MHTPKPSTWGCHHLWCRWLEHDGQQARSHQTASLLQYTLMSSCQHVHYILPATVEFACYHVVETTHSHTLADTSMWTFWVWGTPKTPATTCCRQNIQDKPYGFDGSGLDNTDTCTCLKHALACLHNIIKRRRYLGRFLRQTKSCKGHTLPYINVLINQYWGQGWVSPAFFPDLSLRRLREAWAQLGITSTFYWLKS